MKTSPRSTLSIERRKAGNAFAILASLLFICLGIWMLMKSFEVLSSSTGAASPLTRYVLSHPALYKAIATFIAVGSAFFAIRTIRAYMDKTPGLQVSPLGLVDASYDPKEALGPIPWQDILRISVFGTVKKVLVVELADPEKYLALGNLNRRRNSQTNLEIHGSPIAIPQSCLNADIEKVAAACKRLHLAHAEAKRPAP